MTTIAVRTSENRTVAVVDRGSSTVAVRPGPGRTVVAAGLRGPKGSPGQPGPAGGAAFQRLAGETISALQAVYELDGVVFVLDYRDGDHIDQILGISLTAALTGEPMNVQRAGVLDDASWSWAPGRVWLGADGALTQTPPADGFDVLIGCAVGATRITLNLSEPIDLEE
ncbi:MULTISPECIES: hypothetical protein [unclassified Pseudomonas]|uniref:hypothetical protein n=1 Tax=unclassified Pseudomonas TaxID=196821 RepID=UPI00244BD78A|nr:MULTISPECIES: hypothetical protein [unclassified Pseudomonas]MDG9927417.1 hypothetical protein [Pseudomonas sp. GD04042]MDH0482486.1 hypothetical protein [Pseudomonas sp. GD04015]MDH0602838.1 hypothetical protein [Pseudomonas sp. GD03869]